MGIEGLQLTDNKRQTGIVSFIHRNGTDINSVQETKRTEQHESLAMF